LSVSVRPPDRSPALKLPLTNLPWRDFEEFVLEVVSQVDSLDECRLYGLQGQAQFGIDLIGRTGGSDYVAYQVKQEGRLTVGRISAAVNTYISAGRKFDARKFVYVSSASARSTTIQDEVSDLHRAMPSDLSFALYDSEWLTAAIRSNDMRGLVARYFGIEWARAILGDPSRKPSTAHSPADAKAAYLVALRRAMNAGPSYFPIDLDLSSIRQPVRILGIERKEASFAEALEEVRSQTEPSSERPTFRLEPGGADDSENLDWEELLSTSRRLVVLGDPGTGKSWLLRFAALTRKSDAFPVFVSLARLSSHSGSAAQDVADAALAAIGLSDDESKRQLGDAVRRQIDDGRALLLFDGLDEVAPERLEEVRRLLAEIASIERLRMVVTSRFAGYADAPMALGPGGREVEVVGFDAHEVGSFIDAWFHGNRTAAELRNRLLGEASLRTLARSPLLLSFICLIAESGGDLPIRKTSLLETIMHMVLGRRWRGDSAGHVERIDAKLRLCGRLAFAGAEAGFPLWMPAQFVSRAVRATPDYDWLEASAPADRGVVHELSQLDGILVPPRIGSKRSPLAGSLLIPASVADGLLHRASSR